MFLAYIRENDCIGCKKCINACPVDSIIGSNGQIHTVLSQECIGCKLCVPACPVDCIDLVAVKKLDFDPEFAKQRHRAKKLRLQKQQQISEPKINSAEAKKAEIMQALARVKKNF